MTDVLILTGFYKTENLPKLYESIKREFVREKFNVMWFLCMDKFHTKTHPGEFFCHLLDEGFVMPYLFTVGEDKPNYGGALFNYPLKWAMENGFEQTDPWVYILDHDNIVNPLIPFFISECEEKYPDKTAMWLNFMTLTGNVYLPDKYTGFSAVFSPTYGGNIALNTTDPSSLVLKFSVYLSMFPISDALEYDVVTFRPVMEKLWTEGKLIMQNDMEYWRDRAGAYHNAIIEDEVLDKHFQNAETEQFFLVMQDGRFRTDNEGRVRIVLPKEANEEILKVVKKYI